MIAMRNAKLQLLAVSVLVLLLVMLADVSVRSRQAACSPEVEVNEPCRRTTREGVSMRRLQTIRPSPLGYPPPPKVAEPPLSPSPSPSVV